MKQFSRHSFLKRLHSIVRTKVYDYPKPYDYYDSIKWKYSPAANFVFDRVEPVIEFTSKQELKFMHWNVHAFHTKLKDPVFTEYIGQGDFDFLMFNETRYSPDRFKNLQVHKHELWEEKYNHYWCFSTKRLGYAGVGVLSRMKALSSTFGFGNNDFDSEGRVITLEFDDFYLVSIYSPNSGQLRLENRIKIWEKGMHSHLKSLSAHKKVIVIGDFNVVHTPMDLFNPKSSKHKPGYTELERECFSNLLALGMKDAFRHKYPDAIEYSWWSRKRSARQKNYGWRFDYCLISDALIENLLDIKHRKDILGSDHCPIEVTFTNFLKKEIA
jgi:exodeoxyribonuclease-3